MVSEWGRSRASVSSVRRRFQKLQFFLSKTGFSMTRIVRVISRSGCVQRVLMGVKDATRILMTRYPLSQTRRATAAPGTDHSPHVSHINDPAAACRHRNGPKTLPSDDGARLRRDLAGPLVQRRQAPLAASLPPRSAATRRTSAPGGGRGSRQLRVENYERHEGTLTCAPAGHNGELRPCCALGVPPHHRDSHRSNGLPADR